MNLNNFINRFYFNKFLSRFFHTTVYCLQRELEDCETILDIGCGPSSPVQYCQNIKYSLGIEPFKPYLDESKERKIHTKYLAKKIENLDFPKGRFDAVVLLEIVEHLPKEKGRKVLEKAEKWARKKIIISTPNGMLPQDEIDKNPWQRHLSGWSAEEFRRLGYHVYGLAGVKFLRKKSDSDTMSASLLSPIKFRPRIFWFLIVTLTQSFVYFFPKYAFEIFCIKNK